MIPLFEAASNLQLVLAKVSDLQPTLPAVVLIGIVVWVAYSYMNDRHAPPGPPRIPFLGNVLQVPNKMQFLLFAEWSQKYGSYHSYSSLFAVTNSDSAGSIFSLKLLGQNVVVLNTHKAVIDLFGMYQGVRMIENTYLSSERRSNIYSSRPRMIMAGEILTSNMFLGFLQYGDLYVSFLSHMAT
jgi:hypothetical protein